MIYFVLFCTHIVCIDCLCFIFCLMILIYLDGSPVNFATRIHSKTIQWPRNLLSRPRQIWRSRCQCPRDLMSQLFSQQRHVSLVFDVFVFLRFLICLVLFCIYSFCFSCEHNCVLLCLMILMVALSILQQGYTARRSSGQETC